MLPSLSLVVQVVVSFLVAGDFFPFQHQQCMDAVINTMATFAKATLEKRTFFVVFFVVYLIPPSIFSCNVLCFLGSNPCSLEILF